MRNKKAISLILLVITIIVMIILASAVIMSLSNVNIMNKAEDAVLRSDAKNFLQEANLAFVSERLNDASFVTTEVNATSVEDMKKYIPDFNEKYYGKLIIQNGEVVYVAGNVTEEEKQSFEAVGIKPGDYITKEKADEIKGLEDKANIPEDTTTTDVKDVIEAIPEDYADMFTIFQGHLYYRWEKTTSDERISLYNAGIPALLGDCNEDGTLTAEDSELLVDYDGFEIQYFEGTNNNNTYYIGDLNKDNIIDGSDAGIVIFFLNDEEDAYLWMADSTKVEQNPTKLEFLGDYNKVWYQAEVIAQAKDTNSYAQIMNLAPGLSATKAKRFAIIHEIAVYRYETLNTEEITWLNEAELNFNLGDINLDGKLTDEDYQQGIDITLDSNLYTEVQKFLADLDCDTFVDVGDAARLKLLVAGRNKLLDILHAYRG